MTAASIPAGYRKSAAGYLVPEDGIHALDLLRDQTVTQIIDKANVLQEQMRAFKTAALADIEAFCKISAEKYGFTWGGKRGNLSMISFDGRYKVQIAIADTLSFDERVQIAKGLIDECIHEWAADSNVQIRTLIEHAFQADKEGNISTSRIFSLLRVKIEDPKWLRGMDALRDSIQVTATSQYLRLYERVEDSDQYRQIAMDIARL